MLRNLEVIIGRVEVKNQKQEVTIGNLKDEYQKLFIIGLALAVGAALVVIALVVVGTFGFCHFRKSKEPHQLNNIELQGSFYSEIDPKYDELEINRN
jgi:hypothetical protein